jgi:hypothetical protein
MIMTSDNRSIQRKTRPIATLSSTNLTRTDLLLNPDLRYERHATKRLSHTTEISLIHILLLNPYRAVNTMSR